MKVLLVALLCISLAQIRGEDCFDYGKDYVGFDLVDGQYDSVPSAKDCQARCQQTSGCEFWTWDPNYHSACWKKSAKGQIKEDSTLTSGPKFCDDPTPSDGSLKVMSYNLFGWNALHDSYKTQNLYKTIRAFNPDILGCQEDEGKGDEIAGNIGSDYRVSGGRGDGHSIIYRSSVLILEASGRFDLSPHDKWGTRSVEYAHFTHQTTGQKVDFFNTHFCVCTDQISMCCGQEGQYQSAVEVEGVIESYKRPGSLIFFTGDLNVIDGTENAKAIKYLKGEIESPPVPLVDTFRVSNGGSSDGATFPGLGKIDYIFGSPGVQVSSAVIDRNNYGPASDHWPINAVIKL